MPDIFTENGQVGVSQAKPRENYWQKRLAKRPDNRESVRLDACLRQKTRLAAKRGKHASALLLSI
jgi:hypothetical protein